MVIKWGTMWLPCLISTIPALPITLVNMECLRDGRDLGWPGTDSDLQRQHLFSSHVPCPGSPTASPSPWRYPVLCFLLAGSPTLGFLCSCLTLVHLPFPKIVFGKEKQPIIVWPSSFPGAAPHFWEWQRLFHAIPNGNCECSEKVEEWSICKSFILPQSCDLFHKIQIDVCIQSLNSKTEMRY